MKYRPGNIDYYLQAYRLDNFIYFAVPKNGLMTFTRFFIKNGWESVNLNSMAKDDNTYIYFSHIRNPHSRHTKGLAQLMHSYFVTYGGIKYAYELLSKDKDLAKLFMGITLDEHTLPISSLLPEDINPYSIDWIPLDHPNYSSEDLTNRFFKKHGIDLKIELDDRLHVSNPEKRELNNLIDNIKDDVENYKLFFTSGILKKDLVLYDTVIKRYMTP